MKIGTKQILYKKLQPIFIKKSVTSYGILVKIY